MLGQSAEATFAAAPFSRTPMFTPATTPPRIATLVFLTALSVVTGNMFLPSLADMARYFGVDYASMSLAVSVYLAITGLLQLMIGPLSDRFGRRPVLLTGMSVFMLASIGCALADDIGEFLVFRVLQGAVASGSVLSQVIIRDRHEPREATRLVAFVSMAMAVGPMIGPMVGGILDELHGWRANFYAYTAFGALALALCWLDVGETNQTRSGGFAAQMKAYPELLRSRVFWSYSLCLAFSIGAFFAFISGVPHVGEHQLGISPARIGLFMAASPIGFFCGSFLTSRLTGAFSAHAVLIAGRVVACLGLSLGLALVLSGVVNELTVFGSSVFVGLGNGLSNPNASVGAISVNSRIAGSAAGLFSALIVGCGALLTVLTGAVVDAGYGAAGLLGVMLATSVLSLIAALSAWAAARAPSAVAEPN